MSPQTSEWLIKFLISLFSVSKVYMDQWYLLKSDSRDQHEVCSSGWVI